ncbi:hypothetical protein TNCV_1844811 [Trichonephila clavipes]|nr:hypothetical protein TNCV_1844811 [Trichonephila clavipes]
MDDPIRYELRVISIATGTLVKCYNPKSFSSSQHMQLLPWPGYSPDMSPIEHLWDLVDQRLVRDPRPAASKDKLLN